jgi:hypothetical protein
MPRIKAASTPSRNVTMNACNISQTPAAILKMNFNFNITRITGPALQRQSREVIASTK